MDNSQLTDRQRKKMLSDLLRDTRRKLMVQRGQDISWTDLSEEIGLGTPISMSQYQNGQRVPDGRNMIMLARWFRREMNVDLYDYLGFPAGGPEDPRLEYIYDLLETADKEVIERIMRALKRNGNGNDTGDPEVDPI